MEETTALMSPPNNEVSPTSTHQQIKVYKTKEILIQLKKLLFHFYFKGQF